MTPEEIQKQIEQKISEEPQLTEKELLKLTVAWNLWTERDPPIPEQWQWTSFKSLEAFCQKVRAYDDQADLEWVCQFMILALRK